MPLQVDGVISSDECPGYQHMINSDTWQLPSNTKIPPNLNTFDDHANCTVYVAWAAMNSSWVSFTRDASNNPMGGIGSVQLDSTGTFSYETGGFTMAVTANNPMNPQAPDLSFNFEQISQGTNGAIWASGDDDQSGCHFNIDSTTGLYSTTVGLHYWSCPFDCSIAK